MSAPTPDELERRTVAHVMRRVAANPVRKASTRVALLKWADLIETPAGGGESSLGDGCGARSVPMDSPRSLAQPPYPVGTVAVITNGKYTDHDTESVLAVRVKVEGEGMWFVPSDGAYWSDYDIKEVRPQEVTEPKRRMTSEEAVRLLLRNLRTTDPTPRVLRVIKACEAELAAGTHESQAKG